MGGRNSSHQGSYWHFRCENSPSCWTFSLPPPPQQMESAHPPSHCDNQKCSHTFPNARWKGDADVGWESLILHPEQARHKRLTAILYSHFAQRTLQMKLSFYPTTFINKADIINYQNTWNLSIRNNNPKMIHPLLWEFEHHIYTS